MSNARLRSFSDPEVDHAQPPGDEFTGVTCPSRGEGRCPKNAMSWFLKLVGTPAAVKAKIQADGCLSPALKTALAEMCDDKPYSSSPKNGISIEGSGHSGEGSYINALKVERITIEAEPCLPPAAAPTTPPPVSNANVAEGCEKFAEPPPAASTETPAPAYPEANPLKA